MENKDTRHRCRAAALALERAGVAREDRYAVQATARRIMVAWASPEDRPMLGAAKLVLNPMLPMEDTGNAYLPHMDRQKKWLEYLFENAVRGFYHRQEHGHGWKVHPTNKRIRWRKENVTAGMDEILPNMEIDIELTRGHGSSRRIMIIDTKFTNIVVSSEYRKNLLRSGHIYQMYAYLRSQEQQDDPPSLSSSGMLLYPSVGEDFDESVAIQGHKFRFATVDLTGDKKSIEERLLGLVRHA